MESIHLNAWYGQPVHCPFCGDVAPGRGVLTGCWHYVYVMEDGELKDYGSRLQEILCLDPDEDPLALDLDIASEVNLATTTAVEYRIDDPEGNLTMICFAARTNELCGMGRKEELPYQQA